MPKKPCLVPTDVAATFIVRCRNQELTPANIKAARDHIYYLAKQDRITRYGEAKRGQSLWDLHELAAPYARTVTVVDKSVG